MSLYVRITIWGVRVKNMFSDVGKTLSCYTPPIFTSDSSLFLPFGVVAFLAVTLFGGLGKEKIKKAIFPDSQSFVNLKSNTMKNTMQRYVFLR